MTQEAPGPNDVTTRQGHAAHDLPSRRNKAFKIERLLKLTERNGRLRLLEVGCGTGGIAHYFATHPSLTIDVEAVDLIDKRTITDHYHFTRVDGTTLPFDNESFDVVISNHVIEHVGDDQDQIRHLVEMRRVLKRD